MFIMGIIKKRKADNSEALDNLKAHKTVQPSRGKVFGTPKILKLEGQEFQRTVNSQVFPSSVNLSRPGKVIKVRKPVTDESDSSDESISNIGLKEVLHISDRLPLDRQRAKRSKIIKSYEVVSMQVSRDVDDTLLEESSRIAELERMRAETEALKTELQQKLQEADETLAKARQEAETILEEAKQRAEELLKQAQVQAQQLAGQVAQQAYEEAYQKGQTEGYNAGYQLGYQRGFETSARAALLFKEELKNLIHIHEELVKSYKEELIKLALEIAKHVIGREIRVDETIVWNNIMSNVEKLRGRDELTIWVNPDDMDYVRSKREELKMLIEDIKTINVMPDPKIERGGCVIESSLGTIDARINVKLEAITELLKRTVEAERDDSESQHLSAIQAPEGDTAETIGESSDQTE